MKKTLFNKIIDGDITVDIQEDAEGTIQLTLDKVFEGISQGNSISLQFESMDQLLEFGGNLLGVFAKVETKRLLESME